MSRVLYLLACGAEPAADLQELAELAVGGDWDVYVGATPTGSTFLDDDRFEAVTGRAPRSGYSGRSSGWPKADVVAVAPATLNTVGKFAAGIADCWALSVMTEALGYDVPIVIAPHTNPALSRHPRFRQNLAELRSWGVVVLDPRPDRPWMGPWSAVLGAISAGTPAVD